MSSSSLCRYVLAALFAGIWPTLVLGEGSPKSAAPLPAALAESLLGTWDVERVAVDLQDQAHWGFQPDDPQLLGRTLVIEPKAVRFNGMPVNCPQAQWTGRATTWSTILAKGFKRPTDGGRSAVPRPTDFDLTVKTTDKVTVFPICQNGGAQPKGTAYLAARWVAPLGAERLVIRLNSSALLLLKRRTPGAKITPSFSCGCAKALAEKTICASHELAAWDRSLAVAWSSALERTQDEPALRQEQKTWLQERNACQADAACIEAKLAIRVAQLASSWPQ